VTHWDTLAPALPAAPQHGEFKRVGGNTLIKVNIRIVAATNRNLQEAIKNGRFRQDLFFRLDVLTVEMPRLSERREDYPAACGARHEKLWPNPYASVSACRGN